MINQTINFSPTLKICFNRKLFDLKSETGFPIRDPVKKAELIHRQFDSVFSNPSPPIESLFSKTERTPNMEHIHVTSPGIKKILGKLDPHKALGPDNIPGIFLKICAVNMADVFSFLFQASLDQGVVPPDWKTANVVPLFKKGDKSQPENYRPISLTSITCKVLELIVFSMLMSHFDKFNILDDTHNGFRKKKKLRLPVSTLVYLIEVPALMQNLDSEDGDMESFMTFCSKLKY